MAQESGARQRAPRVAVVAVHGVADQEPCSSAREVASLLHDPGIQARAAHYGPFREVRFRVPVRPITVSADQPQEQDQAFTWQALRHHAAERERRPYETLRLEGRRSDGVEVHVHELYWADLSRLGHGALRIFGELYQLLFHVTRLGVRTAEAAADATGSPLWRALHLLAQAASRLFAWFLPALNLLMAALVLIVLAACLVSRLPLTLQWVISAAFGGLLLGGVQLALLRLRPVSLPFGRWVVLSLVPLVPTGALFGWFRWRWLQVPAAARQEMEEGFTFAVEERWAEPLAFLGHYHVLALTLVILAGVAYALLMRAYARRWPQSQWPALLLGLAALAAFVVRLWAAPNGPSGVVVACIDVLRLLSLPLRLVWTAIFGLLTAVEVVGIVLAFRARATNRATRRAAWTTRLTLALPVLAFLLLTLGVWSAALPSVLSALPEGFHYHGTMGEQVRDQLLLDSPFAEVFALVVCLAAVAVALAAWVLLPVVWAEVKPPRPASSVLDEQASRSLGLWLNHAYRFLTLSGLLVMVSMAWVPTGSFFLQAFGVASPQSIFTAETARTVLGWIGATLGAGALGLFALKGRFEALSLGFRSLLDVLLDVDNHLKLYPETETPRARIMARYAALLGHLTAGAEPYDAVVIVAHSQGTVITADLLRFLQAQPAQVAHSALARLRADVPLYLFTMGSPLRQLYSLRFPHHYCWARHEATDAGSPGPGELDGRPPDPACLLGVRQWVNAYRSGDYVGRNLWRSDESGHRFNPLGGNDRPSSDTDGSRVEFCVGPGAHTHYWDGTAPQVAATLDDLVTKAARPPGPPSVKAASG